MAFEIQNYQSKYHQDINKMFESGVLECGYNTARGRFPFPFQKLPFFFKKKKMKTRNIGRCKSGTIFQMDSKMRTFGEC